MNINSFFEHWGVRENPFRAEEARQDTVFDRLDVGPTAHPDFEKILGDLAQPATAIVFGEKGSGKTALRIQIARRVERYNSLAGADKTLLIPYDDLNPMLDRFCAAAPASQTRSRRGRSRSKTNQKKEDATLKRLGKLRLVDHMDAILHVCMARLVDALLGDPRADQSIGVDAASTKQLRRAGAGVRCDLMLLQALYDRPSESGNRTAKLRRRIAAPRGASVMAWSAAALLGWILPAAAAFLWIQQQDLFSTQTWLWIVLSSLAIWWLVILKRVALDHLLVSRTARRLSHELRATPCKPKSLTRSLLLLPPHVRAEAATLLEGSDDFRYELFARLRQALRALGFGGVIVILDRIDEPTRINGDSERMQAVIWPLLNNKFLQMEKTGFKLLLPVELRHSLFRESSSFFQEARLDKQNFVERLTWTGATLYDLCTARIGVCRAGAESAISLIDLFEDDVTRQDLVDALDQMRQPRDAFKFLYQCIQEHCANVTQEQAAWRIPRLILETVRRRQSERVEQLFRGVRPA